MVGIVSICLKHVWECSPNHIHIYICIYIYNRQCPQKEVYCFTAKTPQGFYLAMSLMTVKWLTGTVINFTLYQNIYVCGFVSGCDFALNVCIKMPFRGG